MASEIWTPTEFQKRLIANGFPLPQYGADGYWGAESEAATSSWFKTGWDLNGEPPPDTLPGGGAQAVPDEWLPECQMSKLIVHWTAGSYAISATDREHYHIVVDGDGVLHRGDKSIKANVSTSDNDGYAAHTKNCNSGSIGISACCMAGAQESPFQGGGYPLKPIQWVMLSIVAADCCRVYGIDVGPQTVLQHGEVEDNLGIAQDGKWDICKLPWKPEMGAEAVGNEFRKLVSLRLGQ